MSKTLLNQDLKYKLRPEQKGALEFFKSKFDSNTISKYFFMDLPTGVGKSYLAINLIKYYLDNVNKNAKFDVLTDSKILQEQYTNDFNVFSSLWGKQNYTCKEYDVSCSEGKELNKLNRSKCENCPYDTSRGHYINDIVNLTNFHLFILLRMYNKEIAGLRESNVLIIDESHNFEQVFSSFITIDVSESILKRLGFKQAKQISKSLRKINNVENFSDFSEKLLEETSRHINYLKNEILHAKKGDSVKNMKLLNDTESFAQKIKNFIKDYDKRPENWILEYSINDKKDKSIKVEPVWAFPYLEEVVWSKYDHVIFMSGTILNKKLFAYLNGTPETLVEYHSIPSPFAIKNRPIYYMPLAKMTYTNKDRAFKEYLPILKKILHKYRNKKGIIHTVTYEIADWVNNTIKDNRFISHKPEDKDKALQKHYETDEPTCLVSPSMGTGVNLEYDRARYQILMKIPYPSLGSQRNKLRQKQLPEWYSYQTICGIIQAYGRAVRSYDDSADFLILDACFSDVMKYSSQWIPDYISNAIKMVDMKKIKK